MTATVTKANVAKLRHGDWSITLTLTLTEASVDVLVRSFSVRFQTGGDVAAITDALTRKMQGVIDDYKAEQLILASAALAAVVADINSGLVV